MAFRRGRAPAEKPSERRLTGAHHSRSIFVLGVCLVLAACRADEAPKQQQAGPPPAVVTETAVLQDLLAERSFTGRIEAIDKVQVRARVQGFIKARRFEEGAEVKAGDLLFEIDPEPFETAVHQSEANLASAQAALVLAQQTFDRAEELVSRGATSRAQLDTARSGLLQAQGAAKARQAELESARLNLGYTRISAPMDGRVGRSTYSVGNLVGPDSGALVLLVRQDPVYVTFPVPAGVSLQVRRSEQDLDSAYVKLRLADGASYAPEGRIAFSDVQATSSTDSVTVRATIANPQRLLIDQQLVNVSVVRRKPEQKLVIPQAALLLDQQGAYALAVDANSKVEIKRIVVGEQRGPSIVVESGLAAGDRVIVSGHQKARPGATVSAQPARPEPGASAK